MKTLSLLSLLLSLTCGQLAFADGSQGEQENWLNNVALGPSVPATDADFNISPSDTIVGARLAPTRARGGEVFEISFLNPATKKPTSRAINGIRLVAFSKSGNGKVLVRAAGGTLGATFNAINALTDSASVESGFYGQSDEGKVMLANGESASATLPAAVSLSKLRFTFEAFGDDDASVVVQFLSPESAPKNVQARVDSWNVTAPSAEGDSNTSSGTCYVSSSCAGITVGHVSEIGLCPMAAESFLRDFDGACQSTQ